MGRNAPVLLVLVPVVILVGVAAAAACDRSRDAMVGDASTTSAALTPSDEPRPRIVATRDSDATGAAPLATPAPPRADLPRSPQEIERSKASRRSVETTTAEPETPAWVPDSGRLTIVAAPDLYRNLGMVPPRGAPPDTDAAP